MGAIVSALPGVLAAGPPGMQYEHQTPEVVDGCCNPGLLSMLRRFALQESQQRQPVVFVLDGAFPLRLGAWL